jgi:hypothetical protein
MFHSGKGNPSQDTGERFARIVAEERHEKCAGA